jgi:excisionase family DNA binding protein
MEITFESLPKAVSSLFDKLSNIERLLQGNRPADQEGEEKVLTVPQAADFLNLSVPTIYSLMSRGELPAMRKNGRCYFLKSELINYLKSGRRKTNAELQIEAAAFSENKKGRKHG